jgi:hypothetical protein
MTRVTKIAVVLAVSVVLSAGCDGWPPLAPDSPRVQKPLGLVQLIEFHDMEGLRNWAYELDQRSLSSLVYVTANILEDYPDDVRWLSDRGHEIAGGYAEEALWDVPYETQLQVMQEAKESVEGVTGRPMRAFGSRYFAYDENTLKAADALGVEYVLARGTSDVEALHL